MKLLRSSVFVPSISVFAGLIFYLLLSGAFIRGFNPLAGVVEATKYGSFTYLTNELYYETSAASFNMEDMYNSTYLYDFSNGRSGEKTGSIEFESGVYGQSLRWPSGQIVVQDLDIIDMSFTVEAWIFPTSEASIALAGTEKIYPYIFKDTNGSMLYQWAGGVSSFYSSQPVKLNAWTHVAFANDIVSGVAKWYLNGTEYGSKKVGAASDWDGKWSIGHMRPDYLSFEWKGKIDEFRIYKGEARTQKKIQQDMNTPIMHKLTLTGLTPNSDVAQLWYTSSNPYGMLQQTADADGKLVFNVYSFSDGEPFYNGVLKVVRGAKTYTSSSLEFKWEDIYSFDVHSNYTEAEIALFLAASTIIVPSAVLVIYRYVRKHRKLA